MSETIHLILIESHAMVRAGFRMLFEAQPDMAVIGEAESASEGLALLETVRPDVVLLDVSIPATGGPEITTRLKGCFPDVRILALAIHDSQADLLRMLDAGVDGYLPKRAAAEELLKAVRAVHAGERYVHPSLVGPPVLPLIGPDPARPEEKPPPGVLTRRQLQVLGLVANGLTSQKVGEALGLSGRTVDRHIENMLRKLKMHSRVELVLYAAREGLIDMEDRSS